MAAISCLMSNGIILLKRPRGLECENNLYEVMAWEFFQFLTLIFEFIFNVTCCHLTTKAFFLLYFSYITDPKAGDNRCGSGLVFKNFDLWKCTNLKFYFLSSYI